MTHWDVVKSIEDVTELMESHEFSAYIGKYEDVKDIAEELICEYGLLSVDGFMPEDYDGYDKAFYLYLSYDGVSIERCYNEETNKLFNSFSDIVIYNPECLYMDEVNSADYKYIYVDESQD